jgi:hypothetical protein
MEAEEGSGRKEIEEEEMRRKRGQNAERNCERKRGRRRMKLRRSRKMG